MGVFKKNKNKITFGLTEGQKTIYKYIVAHTQNGVSLEQTRIALEAHKEKGNYSTEDINEAIAFLQKKDLPIIKQKREKIKKEHLNMDLSKEIKNLPRKQRKKALKLLEMYEKGQYLRPNEDVNNKSLILEKE